MLRQDLTPVEEAEGLQALMTEQKYTQEQLGGIITIAKKKQARSMTTAYIAYKAITKIRSIDTSSWTDDNKTNFQTSLTSLKTEIDNYLNPAPKLA